MTANLKKDAKSNEKLKKELLYLQKKVKKLSDLSILLKKKENTLKKNQKDLEQQAESRASSNGIINRQLHAEIEHRRLAEQVAQDAQGYAESIVNTVREPLLVLDGDLMVISASQSFYQMFGVKPEQTEKQHIYELGNRQWNIPRLRHLLENILYRTPSFDDFEVEHDFPSIGKRIMLLNARLIHQKASRTKLILLAIEDITLRKRLEEAEGKTREELRALSVTDPLTGLYNRRGFLALAQQQIKISRRDKQGFIAILFADIDEMKMINDKIGHKAGDTALTEVAEILKASFRDSDIISRIGGDEFVVLGIHPREDFSPAFTARLQENLDKLNSQADRLYKLSLSIGIAYCPASQAGTVFELISQADALMYKQKQSRKSV